MTAIPPGLPGSGGRWSRREILLGGAAAALALARRAAAAADAAAPQACVLTPELTEGPYYLDRPKLRHDITEGKPGVPLILRVTLLEVGRCRPLRGAAVDLWHCDAEGVYSGYGQQGAASFPGPPPNPPPPAMRQGPPPKPAATDHLGFLRGVQFTGADGAAEFRTIVPGWYVGRAVHIHLKAHVGGGPQGGRYAGGHVCHTGQFGFAEDFYSLISPLQPYARHQVPRTRLEQDGILGSAGPLLRLAPLGTESAEGYLGNIACAVDTQARPRIA